MNIKRYTSAIVALTTLATLATAIPALASTTAPVPQGAWGGHIGQGMRHGNKNMRLAVFGTVSAISGNIITVTGKQGFGAKATATTFTVDATNAKIMKDNTASTISSIAVGDTIMAQGTLTGTNLVATTIRDGVMKGGPGKNGANQNPSAITGNGQPIVAGTVSAISGSTLTITNKSNVTYTVDATNAKITQDNSDTTLTVSNITVGDMVVVQGAVNGNSVVASNIIDQAKPANGNTATSGAAHPQPHKGFFGAMGSFFSHIFGF
jgi:hypothetical protein